MENYEYEKDFFGEFAWDEEEDIDYNSEEAIEMRAFLEYHREELSRPHYILPFAPSLFEETVKDCEQIAKEFAGRIKATINYTSFYAKIELWCLYVEFRCDELMPILQKLSQRATMVEFIPTTSNDLRIVIELPYFALLEESCESD